MKLDREKAKALLRRYFDAETSEAEERQLRRFLVSEAAVGPEFDEARAVMSFLAVGRRRRARVPVWKVAALAASFLGAISLGTGWIVFQQRNECVAYIYGEKVTNPAAVWQQAQESLQEMGEIESADISSQLTDMFNTSKKEEEP